MKIGVLTLPLKGNYGGVLQAFALVEFLKSEGHDTYLIDRQWDIRENKTLAYYIKKYIFHHYIIKNVKKFSNKWVVPKTFKIDSQKDMLLINNEGFDAFVVGSDQVWRVENIQGIKNNFFLDFVTEKKVKKISYAASFGKDSVDGTPEKLKEISALLKEFSAISVREASGVKICEEVFNVKAEHLIDPTLLLPKEKYITIIEESKRFSSVATVYVLDNAPAKLDIIKNVVTKLNLKINSINYKKDPGLLLKNKAMDIYNYKYPSVSNWLRGFRDADFVITDSFHGMLFSVIFKKQFLIIGNEKRGMARFESFLTLLNLKHRLITVNTKNYLSIVDEKIDYKLVDEILKREQLKSKKFFKEILNKE